ncbi:MAG: DUF4886 domain-containing protein [Fermentimonas sp.]|nr:DUF4886 domain-containing protein [Fermentimonas sp.]
MKTIKYILGILLMFSIISSCQDELSVDLSQRKFVRINKQSVYLNVGEKMILSATVDSLGSINKTFNWSVMDSQIATIESGSNNTAVITGIKEGNTVIKVESSDGELKYFTDLSVSGEKAVKILAIGNSFSEDAIEYYLYDLAKAAGHEVIIGNMYIGGQSLEGHWKNASENNPAYQLRYIGSDGAKNSFNDRSLMEVISDENWDYISFQEVSQLSGIFEGYQEYLPKLLDYAANLTTNPDVKFIMHQTWAYAEDSNHFGFPTYNNDQMTMYNAIVDAVWKAKDATSVDLVVPAGTAIQNGRTSYIGDRFTRDGYHLNLTIGRFTASCAWFESIFGGIKNNTFVPSVLSEYDAMLAKTAAFEAVESPKSVTQLIDFKYPEPNDFVLNAPMFIDFGEVESPAPYNNFRHPNDQKIGGLIDFAGNNSNFALEVAQSFSGTLERGLQNVLGLPRSASQDMFFTDGIRINESGFLLSNLNRDQKYTLVFYGSINDNNTETEFHVIGKNEGTGSLDNDNNLGKLVVIENIEPAEDATITIKMRPGQNNEQWAKFFGINAMMVLPEGMPVPVEPNTFNMTLPVYIDFGLRLSSAPFFNILRPNNDPHFDLPDASGANTGIALSFTSAFNGENQSGAFDNLLGLPGEVTVDALWSNRDRPRSGFTLYRLDPAKEYQFVFFGSRNGVTDNRETKYEAIGKNRGEALLNSSNNNSNVVVVSGIQPTPDGIVDIRVSAGPNNNNGDRFYYLNSFFIAPDGYVFPY